MSIYLVSHKTSKQQLFRILITVATVLILCEIFLFRFYTFNKVFNSTTNIKTVIFSRNIEYNIENIAYLYNYNNYSCPENKKHQRPNCSKLISGHKDEYWIGRRFSRYCSKNVLSDEGYVNLTKECTLFRKYLGYFMKPSEEEIEFPLAFSIMMYKDVHQTEQLLRTIYRPSNYYCIHVDNKASDSVKVAMENIIRCLPNVQLASKLINVKWGRFSVLESEVVCMKDLLKYKHWKYFINLTGQEFPLKTNLQIVRILKLLNGANSVDGDDYSARKWKLRWKRGGIPPHGINPIKGNLHAVLNREFVDYAVNNPIAKDFLQWLRKTRIPDETFFPSLNYNPVLNIAGSYRGTNINTNWNVKPYIARFKLWSKRDNENSYFHDVCRGKYVRGICVFGIGDLPNLTSRVELFANKFHWSYQSMTLDCLSEWYRSMAEKEYKTHGESLINLTYYKHIPYIKDIVKPLNMDGHLTAIKTPNIIKGLTAPKTPHTAGLTTTQPRHTKGKTTTQPTHAEVFLTTTQPGYTESLTTTQPPHMEGLLTTTQPVII